MCLRVVSDSCQIVGLLSKEINRAIENTSSAARLEFISAHHKVIKRLLKVFGRLLKSNAISFYVLHVFGNEVFIDFVRQVLRMASDLSRPIFESFPQKKEDLVVLLHDFGTIVV